MRYGYARVSSTDQSLDVQLAELRAAGCRDIRSEKITGTTMEGRGELNRLLAALQSGDELYVTRIDRFARSIEDLATTVKDLKRRGVAFRATQQSIDTSTAEGEMFLQMLGVFAEFETKIRRNRQMEGIAKRKAAGLYKGHGRKPTAALQATQMRAMSDAGVKHDIIAARLNVSLSSVYRILKEARA